MKRTDIERLNNAVASREQLALVTWLATGEQKLFEHPNTSAMDADLELSLTLSDAFNKDRSTTATIDGDDVFIKVYNPALRMIIIGAAYGIGKIGSSAVESMARQPEVAGNINTAMIIAAALIEGVTFFALIVCLLNLFVK